MSFAAHRLRGSHSRARPSCHPKGRCARGQPDSENARRRAAPRGALRNESRSPKKLATEISRLKKQAANLVRFLADGGSAAVRAELNTIEQKIATVETELAAASNPPPRLRPKAHRQWLLGK